MKRRRLTFLEKRETKQFFAAAFDLYPKFHENVSFLMDYIRFAAEYGNRKKVISIILSALEDDPYNDYLLSVISDEYFCIVDNRIEVLFIRALSYHKECYIHLLYADYLRKIVKDNDRAYTYYKISMDEVGGIQENVKKSEILCRIAHLMEYHFHDYDAAEDGYIKAIELDKKNWNAFLHYAAFLASVKHNIPEARKNYLAALEINTTEKVLKKVVVFLRETDKDPGHALKLENSHMPPWSLSDELQNAQWMLFFSQKM